MKKLLLVGIIFTGFTGATEFLYPVAIVPDTDNLLIMYQKTSHHIELWQWNVHTKQADTILLSRYTPAGLRLLPDNIGYSFIDNGRIRIKQWAKRSPRSIELDAPITHIELIDWIDQSTCYTSGKYLDHFGIFQISDEGVVYPIVFDNSADLMYPQKVGNSLFFIERNKDRQYAVVSMAYDVQGGEEEEFTDRIKAYPESKPKTVLLDCGLQPIIFLNMVSQEEGFYLTHPRMVSKKDTHILLSYYHIFSDGNQWSSDQIFTFYVPTNLFFPGRESRLYEALLPLVPRHSQGSIFYSDSQELAGLNLYCYSMIDKKSVLIGRALPDHHIFPPVSFGGVFYYGGTLSDGTDGVIKMEIEQEGIKVKMGSFSFIK